MATAAPHLCALERHRARTLWEPLVPADARAQAAVGRVKHLQGFEQFHRRSKPSRGGRRGRLTRCWPAASCKLQSAPRPPAAPCLALATSKSAVAPCLAVTTRKGNPRCL